MHCNPLRLTSGVFVALALIAAGCAGGDSESQPAGLAQVPGTSESPPSTTGAPASTAAAQTTGPAATTAATPDESAPASGQAVEVLRVVDGDTIEVMVEGKKEKVRLIGINTPESGECLADEATARLDELLDERTVTLESDKTDRDQYGRLLRFIHDPAGTNINEVMVADGFAIARSYPPDTSLDHTFAAAQQQAKAAGLGLWAGDACGEKARGTVIVDVINENPPGDDTKVLNEEWISIRNTGTTDVDLTGWQLRDESASHRYSFPDGFVLSAGASAKIRSGCGGDTATDLHWCTSGSAIWNNSGDTAFLHDPAGNLHDSKSY